MIKLDATVKNETRYIAYFCVFLSVLMQIAFNLLKKWTYTVLLGNMLSLAVAVLNFLFMGITVQRAVTLDVKEAKKLMRASQTYRNTAVFLAVVIGVTAPCFNTIAVILPLFFPRIAVSFRPLIKDKKDVTNK